MSPDSIGRTAIQRVLYSLIRSEYCKSRNLNQQEFGWPSHSSQLWLGERGLGLDSLERLDIASQIQQLFDLYNSGIGDRLLVAQTFDDCIGLVEKYFGCRQLNFHSSGSLGMASVYPHTLQSLYAEAQIHASQVSAQRFIVLVPSHHIYGFIWGVLLPDCLGSPVLEGDAAVRTVHQELRAGDLIVGVPQWWKYLSQTISRLPPGIQGVSSTAPLSTNIWKQLLNIGLDTLHEVYGASELGGIGYRQHWSDEYDLLSCWSGLSACGQRLRNERGGSSCILPDQLEFASKRRFVIAGRKDQQVQVAGHNVSPQRVAEQIKNHALVADCQVRLMRQEEGDRLKAQVVTPRVLSSSERSELRIWCAQVLPVYARPHLTFVLEKTVDVMGKAADWPV